MEMGEINLKSTGDGREAYALCDEVCNDFFFFH